VSTPVAPRLSSYTPIRHIGAGGYADVFLYQQERPNRMVAVKVLRPQALAGEAQRRQFTAEADLMGKVSTHPFIVSIFDADISDEGLPYLVMEYYPGDNFLRRARQEKMGVADVLRVGIQVGSAVETAHRAHITHRDIKPANILTSEFRRPGLTDFGIAAAVGPHANEAEGVSIPWSPPEAFGDGDMGVTTDVYSLAATLYHLLAGRSPYEIPGGDNSAVALISRIERGNLPAIGRADVPPSLERTLAQALSRQASMRPARVVDFLRQLQAVESEMRLSVTPLELADDTSPMRERSRSDDDDGQATRITNVGTIHAQGPVAISSVPAAPTGVAPVAPRERAGMLSEPEVDDTVHRPGKAGPPGPSTAAPKKVSKGVLIGGAVAAALSVGVIAVAVVGGDRSGGSAATTTAGFGDDVGGDGEIPAPKPVTELVGVAEGEQVTFTWSAPDALPGDYYEVATEVDGGEREVSNTSDLSVVVDAPSDSTVCLRVVAFRNFAAPSIATEQCVDV
jgi:serine/threonine protein kinase